MHDHLQQLLSAARMKAGLLRRQLNEPAIAESLSAVELLLEQAMAESTALIGLLRNDLPGANRARNATQPDK
jgi:signal transduction histidine kinase